MKKIELKRIDSLFEALKHDGYSLIGPILRDGAIIYDNINNSNDFPIGWTDSQDAAKYRLEKTETDSLFNFTCSPISWKKFLFPPVQKLFSVNIEEKKFTVVPNQEENIKYAFIGVRACELSAIQMQDKIFTEGEFKNPIYQRRRENAFILAVNCTSAKGTCFCTSMGTGPKAKNGFDLALVEIVQNGNHFFITQTGSKLGERILNKTIHIDATIEEISTAEKLIHNAANQMGRKLDVTKIDEVLYANLEHPRWDIVAERCMSCANCTMVCPTCFCSTVEDYTDLTRKTGERIQKWDSCFTRNFSYIHGGSIRSSTKSRYRQWLTHKFASWYKQFDSSGCVGCGRCITWCPVGIDVTEELQAIRETAKNIQTLKEENS